MTYIALELWTIGISDTMIFASLIAEPRKLIKEQMKEWVKDFNSWDACAKACNNLLNGYSLVWKKNFNWSKRDKILLKELPLLYYLA